MGLEKQTDRLGKSSLSSCWLGGIHIQSRRFKEGVGDQDSAMGRLRGTIITLSEGQLSSNLERVGFLEYLKVSVTNRGQMTQ